MNALQSYTGRSPKIEDPLKRAAFIEGVTVSGRIYGRGTADWDQKDTQVILNRETAEHLYNAFTPLSLHYQPGSRPVLERLVNRLIRPEMSEREKVFAVVKYCHSGFRKDYPPTLLPEGALILNAIEEGVLQLNGGQCEDRARLICCLCQIAGIPARFLALYMYFDSDHGYVSHGSHSAVEIHIEGGWGVFDSQWDFYCLRPDGRFASLWDLVTHPELAENQAKDVYKDCGMTKGKFISFRDEFYSARSVMAITNYYLWDSWRYDWKWILCGEAQQKEAGALHSELHKKLLADIGIPPEKIK